VNLFFDLDGTLLDSKPRLYQLFQHLVPESCLTFDDYWALKKDKIGHKEILQKQFNFDEKKIEIFQKSWMQKIELECWLCLDRPFEGVTELLQKLQSEYTLFVVTARQFETPALQQINTFGWAGFFKSIFVTRQEQNKYELISSHIKTAAYDWIVGDTGKDIETGKKLGIQTAAVLSGFLNESKLKEYNPTVVIKDVTNFKG
jgi:phosphoglycolate phosphatase